MEDSCSELEGCDDVPLLDTISRLLLSFFQDLAGSVEKQKRIDTDLAGSVEKQKRIDTCSQCSARFLSPLFFTSRLPLLSSPSRTSVPGVATLLLKHGGSIIGSPGSAVFVFTTGLLCSKSQCRSARPESGFRVSSVSVLSIRPERGRSRMLLAP
ncbi:hypothetical protein NDU88_006117 [Pleurodeles waltl]|uniref:Uncharacterized protein n=1 Tax=Pleurodeles waltl TaxID=8319 RepID=A0AAV7MGM7_PLEWA|nr:hypothetical protein NDU88_006117 [Pleurodeles waltl]